MSEKMDHKHWCCIIELGELATSTKGRCHNEIWDDAFDESWQRRLHTRSVEGCSQVDALNCKWTPLHPSNTVTCSYLGWRNRVKTSCVERHDLVCSLISCSRILALRISTVSFIAT